ncbi:MAG TPA: class I SAM-dependent rRNA methyltransferase [Candidatus Dormibacteraeota bacterium]|nr:class I SAM-dependent rRNA methyltransferase [Candidatus Dormibacteraeota bacterium]
MAEGQVTISQRGAERLRSGHLWVYRSDVRSAEADSGDIVRVKDERGNFVGRAFFSSRSQITVRLLTREDVPVDRDFFKARIQAAAEYRKRVVRDTEAYRLVYSEADLLPSLIVDRYADWLVLQTLSQGTERHKEEFVSILAELFSPRGILERNDPRVRELEGLERKVSLLYGEVPEEVVASRNGIRFVHDLYKGQKTGGFLDQRENQRAAADYASGEVLDCFTYHGGFALTVAAHATQVEAVDLSPPAIEMARRNQELNRITNVTFREANSFDVLKACDDASRRFDAIILDPPAFAKNRDSVAAALRGYKEINLRALKILKPHGFLITSSCSYHILEPLFLQVIAEAANDVKRSLQIVERRTQSRDHPILLTMPETHYLKCFILRVI